MLSIIIPAYNEADSIAAIVEAATAAMLQAAIEYEIVLVDDGSMDGTFAAIEKEARISACVRGLKFSRNFGKEAAILAGLKAAKGDCCVVMDADLQHPPAAISEMYSLWQGGAMIVHGIKTDRGREGRLNKTGAGVFYGLLSRYIGANFRQASDFKLLDRKVIDILTALPEKTRFFRGLSAYYGFSQASVKFSVEPRIAGKTTWSLPRLFVYALDNISSFTAFPLQITTCLGAAMLLVFLVLGIQTLYNYGTGRAVEGFTTVILLLLFIASSLSLCLGIIGHYIAKIYEEVKARPIYILERATDVTDAGHEADGK